jgi:hypothetical protein
MSKGLSKLQTMIFGMLRGTEPRSVYRGGGELTTAELLEELIAREMVNENAPRRQQMFTVRRACDSLLSRGLIEGTYTHAEPFMWARTISWKAAPQSKPKGRGKP